jgi:hypothetical protein
VELGDDPADAVRFDGGVRVDGDHYLGHARPQGSVLGNPLAVVAVEQDHAPGGVRLGPPEHREQRPAVAGAIVDHPHLQSPLVVLGAQ